MLKTNLRRASWFPRRLRTVIFWAAEGKMKESEPFRWITEGLRERRLLDLGRCLFEIHGGDALAVLTIGQVQPVRSMPFKRSRTDLLASS
jgi:hypothetical protein